eukprot:jgi/Bigna1/90097/estExt_fgenesh1_pg.C_620034
MIYHRATFILATAIVANALIPGNTHTTKDDRQVHKVHDADFQCTADEDCNLNGHCLEDSVCECFKGWKGDDCGELNLMPMPAKSTPAYGQYPDGDGNGLASWGGSIWKDPENDKRWHLFVSEMTQGCGLDSWLRNSRIVHATSDDAMGPYKFEKEIIGFFAHEPTVVKVDEGYVMYKIGCADGAITGSNGTGLVGPCTHCSNGTTFGDCPGTDQSYERACQDILFAPTLDGPWERQNMSLAKWNWTEANLGFESHAPVVLENGNILTFTRSWGSPAPLPNSAIWLATADSWNGSYHLVDSKLAAQPALNNGMEDTFMFRDAAGYLHALFHSWNNPYVGAHAFSRDGFNWTMADTAAFTLSTDVEGGSSITYVRRERPHLVLDDDLNPTHLLTAVTTDNGDLLDWSFTHVQAISQ